MRSERTTIIYIYTHSRPRSWRCWRRPDQYRWTCSCTWKLRRYPRRDLAVPRARQSDSRVATNWRSRSRRCWAWARPGRSAAGTASSDWSRSFCCSSSRRCRIWASTRPGSSSLRSSRCTLSRPAGAASLWRPAELQNFPAFQ